MVCHFFLLEVHCSQCWMIIFRIYAVLIGVSMGNFACSISVMCFLCRLDGCCDPSTLCNWYLCNCWSAAILEELEITSLWVDLYCEWNCIVSWVNWRVHSPSTTWIHVFATDENSLTLKAQITRARQIPPPPEQIYKGHLMVLQI
jgi:hypothetical protein